MFSKILKTLRQTAAWRMSLWATLAFAVGTALAFGVMYILVANIMRERSDAWLSGEAEVLAQVSKETPRDNLYDRLVEEVAELATQEVPDERNRRGERLNSVFFLQTGRSGEPPLWVGPGSSEPFLHAISGAQLTNGVPASVEISGWRTPFRVVSRSRQDGVITYLGLSDRGAARVLNHLTDKFVGMWIGMVAFGFLLSFFSAYRTLQRVEHISDRVSRIGSDDLGSRLPEGRHDDEISRLSRTFNHMLDRIQKSVNQLRAVTGSIAHDLKSPVTSIRGSLELALSNDGQRWRESVAGAIEGLDGLSRLLNTTLDLAEAEGGALQLRREPVDLSSVVRQFVDLYQPAMAERHHDIMADLEPGVVVDADASLINRTVVNLLDNELTHLPEGRRIEVLLRTRNQDAELVIEDNGPGFPAELKGRAFQRFVKGEHSTGHGLGLAFVEAVAQAHGGHVKVADRPGGGAILTVCLPLAPALKPSPVLKA